MSDHKTAKKGFLTASEGLKDQFQGEGGNCEVKFQREVPLIFYGDSETKRKKLFGCTPLRNAGHRTVWRRRFQEVFDFEGKFEREGRS